MLSLTIKENQVIKIGDIKVFVRKYKRSQFRIYIEAPMRVHIDRTDEYRNPISKIRVWRKDETSNS